MTEIQSTYHMEMAECVHMIELGVLALVFIHLVYVVASLWLRCKKHDVRRHTAASQYYTPDAGAPLVRHTSDNDET